MRSRVVTVSDYLNRLTSSQVTSITPANGVARNFEYNTNGAFTIEKRNGQKYREVTWAAHQNVEKFELIGGPRVLNVDGTERYTAGNTTTTFDYSAGFSRSRKITERDGLERETTRYLGSYERITTESRATTFASYTVKKTEHRHSIGGFALKTFTQQNGVTSEATTYFLTDHLGSLTASVDAAGVVKERYSFDAWGSRRDAATWSDSAYDALTKTTATNRGYTGHEMLDELGIVHMNGRLYDPELGRVLSGDPAIQEGDNSQNFNRYSYVLNNPLSYTDPSGYFFKKLFKSIGRFLLNALTFHDLLKSAWKKATKWLAENQWAMIVVTIIVGIVSMGVGVAATVGLAGGSMSISAGIGAVLSGTVGTIGFSTLGYAVVGAIGGAIAGGANAALAGGDLGDILKGALIGGIQGAASAGIGHGSAFSAETLGNAGSAAAQTAAHGILGGTVNEAMGGKFQDGFLSAAAAKGATFLPGLGDYLQPGTEKGASVTIVGRTSLAAIIGGTASAVGGGKFANGAYTAAMQHLFNEEFSSLSEKRAWLISGKSGANFQVSDDSSVSNKIPWYADTLHGSKQVNIYDSQGIIDKITQHLGIDSDLIRAILYVEESQGYYDYFTGIVSPPKTIRPMNVHGRLWGLDSGRLAHDRVYNISAGSIIIQSLAKNMAPGYQIRHIATLYNQLGASRVSSYGVRVESVYRQKPWLDTQNYPR